MSASRRVLAVLVFALAATVVVVGLLWATRLAPTARFVPDEWSVDSALSAALSDDPRVIVAARAAGDSQLLIEQNALQETPMASLAKLVLALVVLDEAPLAPGESGPMWQVSAADTELATELVLQGAVSLPMVEGQQLTQRQLLEAALVPSSSSHAFMLATRVFGSVEGYREAAAVWLQREGLFRTVVVDPAGGSRVTRSTPADLLTIGHRAIEHPVIAEIVTQPAVEVPLSGQVSSTNPLLDEPDVEGIKTGTLLDSAGFGLLFSVAPDARTGVPRTLALVIGAESANDRRGIAEEVLERIRSGYGPFEVTSGTPLGTVRPAWGEPVAVAAADSLTATTWLGLRPRFTVPPLFAGLRGDVVGEARFWTTEGERTVPLVLLDDLPPAPWWWRIVAP
jgi:D-alanyl-D-alanine carboxypeptidase (penicillin-binding protein 5/6)